jgi:hypothetical protein
MSEINHRWPHDVKRIMNAMNCTEQEAIYMWNEYSDSLHAGWMGLPKLDSTIRQLCRPYIDGAVSNTKIRALQKENAALREALENIVCVHNSNFGSYIKEVNFIAEQALKGGE